MLRDSHGFSSFSVNDLAAARQFYGEILGLPVHDEPMGLMLELQGGTQIFIYEKKDDHQPATFTVLNFPVEDIDKAASDLKTKGITLERYEGMTDDMGIARGIAKKMGPDIAWFKDPAGNILSVLHEG